MRSDSEGLLKGTKAKKQYKKNRKGNCSSQVQLGVYCKVMGHSMEKLKGCTVIECVEQALEAAIYVYINF